MAQAQVDDRWLKTVADDGNRRCVNFRHHNTSTLPPHDKPSNWELHIARRWSHKFSLEQMEVFHVELLKRVDDFLRFAQDNVGETRDYPIVVKAETGESMDAWKEQLTRLRMPVNFLMEI